MIAILNILIFLIFFIFLIGVNFRLLQQVKKSPIVEATILILIFILGVDLLSLSLMASFYDLIGWSLSLESIYIGYGVVLFTSIALAIMVRMGKATGKKLRTLLRLPVIGALAGLYFKDDRALYLFIAIELSLTLYFLVNREEYNYVFRQQAKALFGCFVFVALMKGDYVAYSFIGLFIYVLMKNQIINQIKLKLVLEKGEDEF